MPALTHGMDIAAVRQSMGQLDQFKSELEQVKSKLDAEVQKLPDIWAGQDSQQFVSSDYPPASQNLTQLIQLIEQLSQKGKQQADEQEATSSK